MEYVKCNQNTIQNYPYDFYRWKINSKTNYNHSLFQFSLPAFNILQEIEIESLEMMSFANANNNEGGGQRKIRRKQKGREE